MPKNIIAANWKMNLTLEEGYGLASEIKGMVADELNKKVEIILIPPFTHLAGLHSLLKDSKIKLGAQNCHHEAQGAYTGEISAKMLKSIGVTYVLVGHSERRIYQNETNALSAMKINCALEMGLTTIYCFGETMEQREAGQTYEIITKQIEEGLFHLNNLQIQKMVLAYEPVWAIGTGKTATPEQAQDIHHFIRKVIGEKYGMEIATAISILYGGSMNQANASELLACQDIDGGLVGGAALESRSFLKIVQSV